MIPLFTTHFSIGKSILTTDRVFELGEELDEIPFVENSFYSFRRLVKKEKETGKRFVFGLKINCSLLGEASKVIVFAKNGSGIVKLRNIYTDAFVKREGVANFESLVDDDLQVAFPFYGGFIHKSIHNFGNFYLPYEDLKDPVFYEEDNLHPYDFQIKKEMDKRGIKGKLAKSIFYEKKDDFPAYQNYRSSCFRKVGRKAPSFDAPEIEDCSSDRFCWDEYKNYGRK